MPDPCQNRREYIIIGLRRLVLPLSLRDLTQPVALLFVGCLHHILDFEDPAGIVARYLAVLAPGSFLVISHSTNDFSPENGRDLVDPGLVLVSYWRPEGGDPGPDADKAWVYAGVAAV